ncbi:hypothetical protein GCM10010302_32130 [Streptomyces polychromogenes]|uniref:Uncharacterized protein n=1 Tax=Streptomyces polychromogenes TaxID=67342 RepID=A0ABP3F590_9ACTN
MSSVLSPDIKRQLGPDTETDASLPACKPMQAVGHSISNAWKVNESTAPPQVRGLAPTARANDSSRPTSLRRFDSRAYEVPAWQAG